MRNAKSRLAFHVLGGMIGTLLIAATQAQSTPLSKTQTSTGWVAGDVEDDLGVFKGIPFAKPPVGGLRWKPPQSAERWNGVKETTAFAPACMQSPNPMMNIPDQPVSEDCLYLNVWTPAKSTHDRLPVIVWIHGGAFAYGSTAMPLFSGAALARRGVVVISIAYRLGSFGFLALPELSAESPHKVSGNYGLLDQIQALRWVRENAAAFGGDPRHVTIMGESAGAISVGFLAQSPLAHGLFVGAIAQSGGAFTSRRGLVLSLHQAEMSGNSWTQATGATSLEQLRAMPAEQLLKATPSLGQVFSLVSSWPIRDGYVVPADPFKAYREGRFNDTPILVGSNDDEGSLFGPARTSDGYLKTINWQFGDNASQVLGAYPAVDDAQAAKSANELIGDTIFALPQLQWARLQARYGKHPVYFYHFAHNPPARPGGLSGPVHGSELPYVFGNQRTHLMAWTDADRHLTDLMGTYWTNFAKTGDPNRSGLPEWSSFKAIRANALWFREGGAAMGPVSREQQLNVLDDVAKKQGLDW